MRKLHYLSILLGMLFISAFNLSAQEVVATISPEPGDYDTLPTEFKVTYEGPTSVSKNIAGGSQMLITSPKGTTQQISGTFSGKSFTCVIPSSSKLPLDENGKYSVKLRANSVYYNWEDGSRTKSEEIVFEYNIKGKEEEPDVPYVPTPVEYDIQLIKTVPTLRPLDIADSELGTLQIYFDKGDLQLDPSANATVTITGPEYNTTASLRFNMNMPTATVFNVGISKPQYSGNYILTIPQGVLGDEEWIKNHEYGHANAEIRYEFTAINGLSTEGANVTISPVPGEYDLLPDEFVVTIDGPESIEVNVMAGNPLLITSPKGTKQQVSGVISGNTLTCKVPSGYALDEKGDYSVKLKAEAINCTWAGGSTNKTKEVEFIYNVIGKEDEIPDGPQPVAYDIEMNKTIPGLRPLDLDMKGIETLQLYFNMAGLKIAADADAVVTISGPNYYASAALAPNMDMATATVFKALFNDPKYDGNYVLTIPQGVLGDADWIKDHSLGHANAEVNYEFTVINGEDPSTITKDLTFNPRVSPSMGSKVPSLSKVTLQFNSKPYWDKDASIDVYYRADLSESGVEVEFGKAAISQGAGNSLVLTITPTPSANGQYSLTIPEGTFWNEEHENDNEAGALNGETLLNWYLSVATVNLEVTGHVPATDAYVPCFVEGREGIVIKTNLKNEVASADFELIEYKLDGEAVAPKTLLDVTSTDVNEDGYICWINNTGNDIELLAGYFYEVVYTLKNESGNVLADGSFEFYGDMETGINIINTEGADRIFNLQGMEIKGENLPAGIYIVNGKKRIVR
ncbi:MAG: hypothetical protein K2N03_03075 [Muribaculaceae bacterium]|nr:hypothetical protein [Muribaculaceae bacterium]